MKLFAKALRHENNGRFEEALAHYETALADLLKTGQDRTLCVKIREKISTLRTVIHYKENLS